MHGICARIDVVETSPFCFGDITNWEVADAMYRSRTKDRKAMDTLSTVSIIRTANAQKPISVGTIFVVPFTVSGPIISSHNRSDT